MQGGEGVGVGYNWLYGEIPHSRIEKGWENCHLGNKRDFQTGTIFYGRCTKGVPFLSKMVYKRVRVWTLGQSLPIKNFVECLTPSWINTCY